MPNVNTMHTDTTMILRFRDLVTQPHGTIESHRTIINSQPSGGEVWWGWWNKQGEQVPVDYFTAISEGLNEHGQRTVYLFDSGHSRLYEAELKEIRWDPGRREIPAPDETRTPDYYKSKPYLAWFKFTNIDDVSEVETTDTLQHFTYLRVDSFFQGEKSKYTPFYGKRVAGPDELRQQDRTIWFVRPVDSADPTHEIKLLESEFVQPTHFVNRFEQSKATRLLWISDVHFSDSGHHRFPAEKDAARVPLSLALEAALRENNIGPIAAVICSGDLTWQATASEYDQARRFVKAVASWSTLSHYRFGFCPGNHDIPFSKDPAEVGTPISVAANDAKQEYSRFYESLFYQWPNEFLACGRRYLLGNAKPIEIVYLNSSLLEQNRGLFQGHGFVGQEQLDFVADEMGWSSNAEDTVTPYRIAVVHHHLIPVSYRDIPTAGAQYSVTLDAEALMRWLLKHEINLVLHGHMHQPFLTRIRRGVKPADMKHLKDITIAGIGSAGVEKGHLGEIGMNTFGILDFAETEPKLTVYSIDPVNPSQVLFETAL